ncbi:ABC transporter ATP-binding protein [Streptomyces sp. NPDC050560]|uniref:ABC transporter ATP-binding protein n=1 Tax=Streptomyces sp. NPDC050560 TaxID=3365630 RepID=UPI00379429C0
MGAARRPGAVREAGAPGAEDGREAGADGGIVVDGVSVEYVARRSREVVRAVDTVSFRVGPGEFVALVGPSGCGKSSLLMAVAGLTPCRGTITTQGRRVRRPDRSVGQVFQSAALFPWRNVLGNVQYGLRVRGDGRAAARARAMEMLELVGLTEHARKYPHELSGGMQQRVNLARALAVDPEILLLDEPFAALDAQTREDMQDELLRIWQETRKTTLLVTHQIDEAVLLADRVVVLSRGPASQVQETVEVGLPRPRDERVKDDPRFLDRTRRIDDLLRRERAGTPDRAR